MNSRWYKHAVFCFALLASALWPSAVFASDDLDVTMRMVTDDETLTESVVREIELDRPIGLADDPGKANKAAKEAREQGRAFGQSVAEQAREAARLRKDEKSRGKPDTPAPGGPSGNPGKSGGGPE